MSEFDPVEEANLILDEEEEDPILDEGLALVEEEDLLLEICTLSACSGAPGKFRGFGIPEDGPTEAQDAEREMMDIVIGMPDPRVLETQELDEIGDHRLDPRPYHEDFSEFLQMQQDRMCAGVIDDGREVAIGSYMSPESVLRMLMGLGPTDIFGQICPDEPEGMPEKVAERPSEVVSEPISIQGRARAVVG